MEINFTLQLSIIQKLTARSPKEKMFRSSNSRSVSPAANKDVRAVYVTVHQFILMTKQNGGDELFHQTGDVVHRQIHEIRL